MNAERGEKSCREIGKKSFAIHTSQVEVLLGIAHALDGGASVGFDDTILHPGIQLSLNRLTGQVLTN